MQKKTIKDIDVNGKRVLVRVDFNVPLNKSNGSITDGTRIRAAVPTIQYLVDRNAKVILCSHLGRPKGKFTPELRLAKIGDRLSQILGRPVSCAPDCLGSAVAKQVQGMEGGNVLLLENLRFHSEEEENDPQFAKSLAGLADIFVNDAFGTAHRAHASTVGVTAWLPAVAGFLLEKELEFLGKALSDPARPFAMIVGGAKVADKIALLENILQKVDVLIIGGGMANTFLKAQGYNVGRSKVEDDQLEFARELIEKATAKETKLLLPIDAVAAKKFDAESPHNTVALDNVPDEWMILDIGRESARIFGEELDKCRTVIWNGPLGVFEFPAFAKGTEAIGSTVSQLDAVTIIGGGDTAAAIDQLGLTSKMTHVSTGGGASMEFLEGKTLPGVAALSDKES